MTSDPESGAKCLSLHQESISESEEKSHDQNTDKWFHKYRFYFIRFAAVLAMFVIIAVVIILMEQNFDGKYESDLWWISR